MNKVYGIVYRTTNLVTGKMYIGKHKVSKYYSGEFDGYFGSGKILLKAIDKYGEHNFRRETLKECYSKEELDHEEEIILKELNCANNENYYNCINTNHLFEKESNYHHSEETKEKIRQSSIKRGISEETRSKMLETRRNFPDERKSEISRKQSESKLGKIAINNGKIEKRISKDILDNYLSEGWSLGRLPENKVSNLNLAGYWEGKKQSESTKQKRSESLTGKVWVHKGSDKTRVDLEDLDKYLSEGWVQGLPKSFSEMRRDAMNSKVIIHKGEIIKTVGKDELPTYLEDGWKPGNMTDSAREKLRKASEGKIWVQNGIEAIKISSEDLQIYLDQGYVRGQKIRPLIK